MQGRWHPLGEDVTIGALPKIEIEVIGLHESAKVVALIDTGFSGHLCLPAKIAESLGLVLTGQERFELANGQWVTQYFFKGKVRLLGRIQEAEILLTDSDVPQVGAALLADYRLTVDFPKNKVRLVRSQV